ncbi:MAG: calcium-binding protein [Pirellulales bacterium]
MLGAVQAGLESETLGKLPVIGDNLNLAGELVGDFRTNFLDPIQATIADPTNLENRLKQVILDRLGGVPGGLGILRPAGTDCLAALPPAISSVNDVDVDIDNVAGVAHINVHLCGQKNFASDFALDLGGVLLNIDTSGGVNGMATYDLELGFGISKQDGFFFMLDSEPGDPEEVEVEFSAFLNAGTMLDARLFFLDVHASDPSGSTGVIGTATIDFLDQGLGAPDRLGLNEITSTSISNLIDARVEADADISLHIEADAAISNDGFLPSIAADLLVDWDFSRTLGEPGSPNQLRPTFEIRDLTLSLGEFLTRVASPIAQKVNKYIEPIRPVLDLLNSRIPGLADAADALNFGPHTWAEAIAFFGGSGADSIARLINILTALDNFVTDVVALNGQPIEINFGDFTFGNQDLRNNQANLDAATPVDFIVAAAGISPTVASQAGAAGGILADAVADPDMDDDGLGISFPILRNPANLLKMLFGQVVDLVVWDIKPLEFEFTVDQEWPVFPPLPITVGIGGVVSAKADFLVGFDTRGLKQTGRFFDGFYIGDTPGAEIELFAGVFGSLNVNLGVAKVGGEAKLGATFSADWHDGNNDGKLYFDELVQQVSGGGLKCVFDFDGALVALFNLFVDPIGRGEDNKRIFPDPPISITLFEFPLPSCPMLSPIDTAHHDFGRLPGEPLSTPEREILVINAGPFAPMREQATQKKIKGFVHPAISEVDEAETFTVRQTGPDTFEVTGYGVTKVYTGPKAILALSGDSNDHIIIDSSVTVPVYIDGGDDDDILDGPAQSTVVGGNGNDLIPRKPRPEIGGKIIGGLGHDIIDIQTDFIPPDVPIDWTIEDGRYGFGTNPFDGDLLFDIDEFGITGTAAADRFDVGNWTGVGTLRGDANDTVVDTRFDHTDFTLGNTLLNRGGSAGSIALDGVGRATLGNVGNDSQYNVVDAGWTGIATVNAGPGSHTVTSSRDTDITLSDTSVSFGNGGVFNFAAAPIRNANFTGGAGANTYSVQNWNGTATIDGGGGHDRIAYRVADGSSNAVTAVGATTIARCFTLRCIPSTAVGGVIYSGIDEIELIGTPGADNLSAGAAPFPVTIRGLGGNDIISGTAFDDSLFGDDGDDTINGVEGIDTLDGGLGNDTLIGFFEPGGEDFLIGGPGIDRASDSRDNAQWILNDNFLTIDFDYTATFVADDIEDALLQGGSGANQFDLSAWSFAATIEGLDGQDSIVDSHDVSFGLSDTLLTRSGLGSITLAGVEVADLGTVSSTASQTFADNGWHGAATFNAGGGVDTLVSQRNANFTLTASQYLPSDGGTFQLINSAFENAVLTGGPGANEFNVGGWLANAMLDGGGGSDTLNYNTSAFSNNASTIAITNATLDRTVLGVPRGHVDFANIEVRNIIGSSSGDTIDASAATIGFNIDGAGGPDLLIGGSGPDSLTGGAGNDTLIGNLGNDTLTGGLDNDRYVYTAAWNTDTIVETAGQGTDTLDFSAVNGTSTISILTTGINISGISSSVLHTGAGIDAIIGGLGNDTINVSNGASLAGGAGTIDGGGGVNTLGYTPFTTPVTVNLSTGAATGFGGVSNIQNVIGGTVNDSLTGDNNDNQLEGRNGNDTLAGLGGNDILIDGTGSDSLDGGSGDDTFRIGHTAGATETISDADGSDTLDYSASAGTRLIDLDNTTTVQQVFTNQFLRINAGVQIENYLGSQGVDTLSIDPLDRAARNVVGNNPTGAPGDVLNYDGKNVPAVVGPGSVHSAGFRPVTFSLWETTNLTNTLDPPPMVTAVRVGFADPLIPMFDIPVGTNAQLAPLPWIGIQRIQIVFSEDVTIGAATDLEVIGVGGPYSIDEGAFTYDSGTRTATWTLERTLSTPDKILLRLPGGRVVDFQGNDLDGEWQNPLPSPGARGSIFPSGDIFPGGDFTFRFNVLPGDVNQDSVVDLTDFHAQRNRQFRLQGNAAYDILFDTDRNGHINVIDGVLALNYRGQSLPAGEPSPSPAAAPPPAAADAVFARPGTTLAVARPGKRFVAAKRAAAIPLAIHVRPSGDLPSVSSTITHTSARHAKLSENLSTAPNERLLTRFDRSSTPK